MVGRVFERTGSAKALGCGKKFGKKEDHALMEIQRLDEIRSRPVSLLRLEGLGTKAAAKVRASITKRRISTLGQLERQSEAQLKKYIRAKTMEILKVEMRTLGIPLREEMKENSQAKALATSVEYCWFSRHTLQQLRNKRMSFLIDIARQTEAQYQVMGFTEKAIKEMKGCLYGHGLEPGMVLSQRMFGKVGREMHRVLKEADKERQSYISIRSRSKEGLTLKTNLSEIQLKTIVKLAKMERDQLLETITPEALKVLGELVDLFD
jgi:hypothetical protein